MVPGRAICYAAKTATALDKPTWDTYAFLLSSRYRSFLITLENRSYRISGRSADVGLPSYLYFLQQTRRGRRPFNIDRRFIVLQWGLKYQQHFALRLYRFQNNDPHSTIYVKRQFITTLEGTRWSIYCGIRYGLASTTNTIAAWIMGQTKLSARESRAASFISYRDEAAPDNEAITEIIASQRRPPISLSVASLPTPEVHTTRWHE